VSEELPSSGVLSGGVHLLPIRVYYEDTDAAGLVYYVNYLKFAERGRTELLRAMGFEQERMRQELGFVFVVRHCTVDYRAAARLDDELLVATKLVDAGAATLEVTQEIRRRDTVLAVLTFRVAGIGADGRPTRLPAELRTAVQSLQLQAAAAAASVPLHSQLHG
jgi:acyl-CoA thioester hydrolase